LGGTTLLVALVAAALGSGVTLLVVVVLVVTAGVFLLAWFPETLAEADGVFAAGMMSAFLRIG